MLEKTFRVAALAAAFASIRAARADLLIDDFNNFAPPSIYPLTASFSTGGVQGLDGPLPTVLGGYRQHTVAPILPLSGAFDPNAKVIIRQPFAGFVEGDPDPGAALDWQIDWGDHDPSSSLNLDVRSFPDLSLIYADNPHQMTAHVYLFNTTNDNQITAASWGSITLPASTGDEIIFPVSSLTQRFDTPSLGLYPAADLSSIDAVRLIMQSDFSGDGVDLLNFALVPEPASMALIFVGMGVIRRRRR